jgi:hypothetical protein
MKSFSTIDLGKIEGTVYTGRDRGEGLRSVFKIDGLDGEPVEVEVLIPPTVISISSSFFLGLFGPSVVRLGDRDAFYKKYSFKTTEFLRSIIDSYVNRALQERNLFS